MRWRLRMFSWSSEAAFIIKCCQEVTDKSQKFKVSFQFTRKHVQPK